MIAGGGHRFPSSKSDPGHLPASPLEAAEQAQAGSHQHGARFDPAGVHGGLGGYSASGQHGESQPPALVPWRYWAIKYGKNFSYACNGQSKYGQKFSYALPKTVTSRALKSETQSFWQMLLGMGV